jgi:hypothetical protein
MSMASFHLTPSRNARRTIATATVLALLAIGAGGSPAARPTRACEEPDPPAALAPACEANALIVLVASTAAETREAVNAIEALGGCAVHVFPPAALIAYVPPQVVMRAVPFFADAYRGEVPAGALADLPFEAQLAAAAWNHTLQAAAQGPTPAPQPPPGEPLVGDVRTAPYHGAQPDGGLAPAPPSPGYYETSEFMAGDVAVGIILPESDGTIDTQTENWAAGRMTSVVTEIQTGLNWWATSANPNGHLTFYYDTHLQVPTGYEPITRSSNDDTLWINGTLATLGASGSDWYSRTFGYLNSIRTAYATDWALVIFVVDSAVDADGKFTDGYFGYTYGFLVVMTYDNDGWGITRMDAVTAHEIGHDFGAGDEYCQPGYYCCSCGGSYGYLGIANSNCEARCVTTSTNCPTCVSINCIMRNNYWGIDTPSGQQVGIRDLDGDTILDPVDTAPTVSILSRPPESTPMRSVHYTGSAQDVPLVSPTSNDVTINHIRAVEYRVDSGTWLPALAADGAWDETTEDYLFTTASLAPGPHTVEIRSVNRVDNPSSLQTDSFVVTAGVFFPLVNR